MFITDGLFLIFNHVTLAQIQEFISTPCLDEGQREVNSPPPPPPPLPLWGQCADWPSTRMV